MDLTCIATSEPSENADLLCLDEAIRSNPFNQYHYQSPLMLEIVFVSFALAAVAAYVITKYNLFIKKQEDALVGKVNIDVELDRRFKLLESLGASATRFLSHESEVFTQVAKLRASATKPGEKDNLQVQARVDSAVTRLMPSLLATIENYPELKGDEVVQRLMESLEHTENRLSFAKSFYNGAVQDFNEARKEFPAVLVASLFAKFRTDMVYWSVSEDARGALESKNVVL